MEKSGLLLTISGKEIQANRPEPIISDIDVVPYKSKINPKIAFGTKSGFVTVDDDPFTLKRMNYELLEKDWVNKKKYKYAKPLGRRLVAFERYC